MELTQPPDHPICPNKAQNQQNPLRGNLQQLCFSASSNSSRPQPSSHTTHKLKHRDLYREKRLHKQPKQQNREHRKLKTGKGRTATAQWAKVPLSVALPQVDYPTSSDTMWTIQNIMIIKQRRRNQMWRKRELNLGASKLRAKWRYNKPIYYNTKEIAND